MMNERLTPIANAFAALTDAITAMHLEILKEANDQRRELIALRERMCATHDDLIEFGGIIEEGAKALTGVADVVTDHCMLIGDNLDGSIYDVIEVDYEDFVGYCPECGDIVSVNDEYITNERNEVIHLDCIECEDEAEEAEAEPEQIAMDIPVDAAPADEVVAENA